GERAWVGAERQHRTVERDLELRLFDDGAQAVEDLAQIGVELKHARLLARLIHRDLLEAGDELRTSLQVLEGEVLRLVGFLEEGLQLALLDAALPELLAELAQQAR